MKLLEWVGTITSVIGSFTVALGYMGPGYILFLIGSICWLVVGLRQYNRPLVILNGTFFVANLIGLVRYV